MSLKVNGNIGLQSTYRLQRQWLTYLQLWIKFITSSGETCQRARLRYDYHKFTETHTLVGVCYHKFLQACFYKSLFRIFTKKAFPTKFEARLCGWPITLFFGPSVSTVLNPVLGPMHLVVGIFGSQHFPL